MKAAGHKPTSRAIRERLGNIGSMGTINKLLQSWRAGQERQIAHGMALPPPCSGRSWSSWIRSSPAPSPLEAELAEQQQEAADLATENERQTVEIEDTKKTVTALQAERSTLKGRLVQMETDLAATRADAAGSAKRQKRRGLNWRKRCCAGGHAAPGGGPGHRAR